MKSTPIPPLASFFKNIKDPRVDRHKKYDLLDIIVITMLAILSGAEGWEDIDDFAHAKESWLKEFLLLKNGIPGHDVYRRVFVRLLPEQVESCFMQWINALKPGIEREVIAIDGKSIRGTFSSHKSLRAVHMVSAWASERRITLGQVKVAEKSNEITAIPQLLEMIALQGCIVTIDAMGCQYEIANKIVKAEADFVFSLKRNQSSLHKDVVEYFGDVDIEKNQNDTIQTFKTFDVDHGRIETRWHSISSDIK
jgi:predicted transposase YbfD/YdcC